MTDVAVLRRFNRSFTRRIGVLDDSYLGAGRPLGPSRLLFEIGTGEGERIVELRRRLGFDSGYVSRLLRQLEADGLVTVVADQADRRTRIARLTPAGRRAWRTLDRRSEQFALRLVAPLTERQRADLDAALATADRLLRAATITFDHVDGGGPDARRAMTAYFAELHTRFPTGFDPGDALATDAAAFAPPTGTLVLLRDDLAVAGCGGLQRVDGGTAEIKRMWIDPSYRGLGLGCRLLTHLEASAVVLGYGRVVLDTNATLTEAIAMYESSGYRPTARYNDNPYAQRWFTKRLSKTARATPAPTGKLG